MDHYLKAERVVESLINEGHRKFILYPFGKQAMMIKEILNKRYGIEEEHIIDNKLAYTSNNKKIISLNKLNEINTDDKIVLLTSDNEEIYSEIRYQIMLYVKLDRIVDVFSYSMYFDKQVYFDDSDFRMWPRVAALEAAAREIYKNNVKGAIAECGVFRGWFSNYMSRFMPDRKLYLFDTFSGFDNRDIDDAEDEMSGQFRSIQNFDDTSIEVALNNIAYKFNAIVRKGYFPDSTRGGAEENEKFAFVSLDTDLYKPIMAGLEFFWEKLNPGGTIFVHDFGYSKLSGARKATLEFCKKMSIGYVRIQEDNKNATAVITKALMDD